jgi:hypothetical protein
MAGVEPEQDPTEMPGHAPAHAAEAGAPDESKLAATKSEVKSHA